MIELKIEPDHIGHVLACLGLWELLERSKTGMAAFRSGTFVVEGHSVADLESAMGDLVNSSTSGGDKCKKPLRFDSLDLTVDWYEGRTSDAKVASPPPGYYEPVQHRDQPAWQPMWSGQQKPSKHFERLRPLLKAMPFDSDLVIKRMPAKDKNKPRFGFDVDSGWRAIDVGFSPNDQKMREYIAPALEILSFIGAQTFQPSRSATAYYYSTWSDPLPICVARGIFRNGSVLADNRYRARLVNRSHGYFTISRATFSRTSR